MYAKSDYVGGTLRSVLDAARKNTTITAQDFGREAGKKRVLKVNYLPPACEDDGTCTDNVCAPGLKPEPTQTYFELAKCTASKVLTIHQDDMRDLDNIGANDWAMALLNQRWATVRRKLEVRLTAVILANRGVQPDGSPTKMINLVDVNTGQLRLSGIFDLERAFLDAELNPPHVIGSAPVYNVERLMRIGTGNDLGQNIGQVATKDWYYDKNLNGAIGNANENLVAFDPQLIKFIGFNENMGRFATDLKGLNPEQMFKSGPDWIYSTINDPATGLLWDLDVIFDKCTKSWNFQFRILWDLFTLPMNVCGIQGLNGIMHFTTCAPKPVDCTGQVILQVVRSMLPMTEYDPGFAYPLIVNDFTINGSTFQALA